MMLLFNFYFFFQSSSFYWLFYLCYHDIVTDFTLGPLITGDSSYLGTLHTHELPWTPATKIWHFELTQDHLDTEGNRRSLCQFCFKPLQYGCLWTPLDPSSQDLISRLGPSNQKMTLLRHPLHCNIIVLLLYWIQPPRLTCKSFDFKSYRAIPKKCLVLTLALDTKGYFLSGENFCWLAIELYSAN